MSIENENNENTDNPQDSKFDDMLIGRIYKQQLSQTRDDLDKIISKKIYDKIEDKKNDFISSLKTGIGK
jgi:hypothetical protein